MPLEELVRQLGAWSKKAGPLHRRLALAVERMITEGILMPGTRLPAERKLALALALSRTTVVTAYNSLRAEGWLKSRAGSGYRVASKRAAVARQTTYSGVLQGSPLIDVLLTKDAQVVDFAAATTKPLSALPRHLFTLTSDIQEALLEERSYMPLGLPALKEALAGYYRQKGIATSPDQILVTTGAQQAISLVTSLYVQRGDTVLTENPTYFGALQVFRQAGARLVPVSVGASHVDPASLRDRMLANGPRLVYLTPTYQNPTGAVMPESARRLIAGLSGEFGVPILEDCTLADMEIDGESPRPIAAFAANGMNGMVVSIGSLSKLYWSGLRIGWVRASAAVISQLARLKTTADLCSPILTQVIASQLLTALGQAKLLRTQELLSRRDLLAGLLREHLPQWTFATPAGGLSLWIQTGGYDTRHFAQFADRYGVALTPGSMFTCDDAFNEYLRIPFLLDEEAIVTGVLRLKSAWEHFRSIASIERPRHATIV